LVVAVLIVFRLASVTEDSFGGYVAYGLFRYCLSLPLLDAAGSLYAPVIVRVGAKGVFMPQSSGRRLARAYDFLDKAGPRGTPR
jgi:hypothetical protein